MAEKIRILRIKSFNLFYVLELEYIASGIRDEMTISKTELFKLISESEIKLENTNNWKTRNFV